MKRLTQFAVLSLVAALGLSLFGMVSASAAKSTSVNVTNADIKASCKKELKAVKVSKKQAKKAGTEAKNTVNNAKDKKGTPDASDAKKTAEKASAKAANTAAVYSSRKEIAKKCVDKVKLASVHTSNVSTSESITVDSSSLANMFEGDVHTNELAFGSSAQPLLNGAPEERGAAAFSQKTLKSPAEVSAWLNSSGDPKAAATKDRVVNAIHNAGYGEDQVQRALNGKGWFLMVVKPESQVLGTTYFVNGQAVNSDAWRQTGEDDAYWLFVASDGKVIAEASVRADCGNARIVKIQIVRPGVPQAPPVITPPIPGEKPALTFDCQQNGIGCPPGVNPVWVQPVQDNTTSGVNVGPTPGAPATAPTQSVQGQTPMEGTTVVSPISSPGYTAPVAPGGGTTTPDGATSGGGPVTTSTTLPVDTGDHSGDGGLIP